MILDFFFSYVTEEEQVLSLTVRCYCHTTRRLVCDDLKMSIVYVRLDGIEFDVPATVETAIIERAWEVRAFRRNSGRRFTS